MVDATAIGLILWIIVRSGQDGNTPKGIHVPAGIRCMVGGGGVRRPEEGALMCSRVECAVCSKITWSGCGQHVDQALAGVPEEQRCTCL